MISPQLQHAVSQAKVDDLRRAATDRSRIQRRHQPSRRDAAERSVMLRFGTPTDRSSVARLAALDSSKAPAQPVLLAEVDGRLVAALSLSDDAVVADPFHHTADLIELLTSTSPPARRQQTEQACLPAAAVVSSPCPGLALGKMQPSGIRPSRRSAGVAHCMPQQRPEVIVDGALSG